MRDRLSMNQFIGEKSEVDMTVSSSPRMVTYGETFSMSIAIDPKGNAIDGVQLNIIFNASILKINDIKEGDLLKKDGTDTFFNNGTIDYLNGTVMNIYNVKIGQKNISTPGTFIIINATAIDSGLSEINISNIKISHTTGLFTEKNVSIIKD
jgi:predicted RecA/RadA family phage recombinase